MELRIPSVEVVLTRLANVRRSGKGWRADCPTGHASRGALSIGERDDGAVLCHCFAGCRAADVIAALGLSLADLFPDRSRDDWPAGRRAARAAYRQSAWAAALGVLARESLIVLTAANAGARETLTADDSARLVLAVDRIQRARDVLT